MKNLFLNFTLLLLILFSFWFGITNQAGIFQILAFFASGMFTGFILMNLKLTIKNKKINSYQRQLEKESISSDKNLAKVKVLESKIQVLEKALENALSKND